MKHIQIAPDLTLPIDAITQRFSHMGRPGSGKTYGAKKMVEEMLYAGAQVVIPEGERKILGILCAKYPLPVAKDTISELTGYARSSRDAYLSRLSSKLLVQQGTGQATASADLFD